MCATLVKNLKKSRLPTLIYFVLLIIIYFYLYGHLTIYGNQDHSKLFKDILHQEERPTNAQFDLGKSKQELYTPSSCLVFIKRRQEPLSNNLKELKFLLESLRFSIKFIQLNQFSIQSLVKSSKKYSLVVFETRDLFVSQSNSDQTELETYFKKFRIGLLLFNIGNQIANFSFKTNELKECKLNSFFFQKHGFELNLTKSPKNHVSFKSKFDFFLNDALASNSNSYNSLLKCESNRDLIVSLESKSNLRIIVFNIDLSVGFPMITTLFIDLLAYLTYGRFWMSNKRYVQIDIDDIFVGPVGRRMKPHDVFELINFQEDYLNKKIFNSSDRMFKFNLGFSGHFYQSGNPQENEADKLLLRKFFLNVNKPH
jgi:hypothetical protein